MKLRTLSLAIALLVAACSQGSGASSCTEFSAEVHALIDSDAPASEIEEFIQQSEEHVAKLISADPERAEPCVTAVLEAVFMTGFADLEEMLTE